MDWILAKMRLVDEGSEQEETDPEVEAVEKGWLEFFYRKKDKMPEENSLVFFKSVISYEDCKLVIDNYKVGNVCIYRLDSNIFSDAQGMMNYICGGLYALDGDIKEVGENVFMAVAAEIEHPL